MAEKRLIDADKLADEFYHMPELVYTDAIARCIEMQPTVDAVPVVRCKNCRYWKICMVPWSADDNFFCALGERNGCEHNERQTNK